MGGGKERVAVSLPADRSEEVKVEPDRMKDHLFL
tara:strand:- start:14 stop:115 length:102 start_codon:yes stop_codon:yes gene_type:complete